MKYSIPTRGRETSPDVSQDKFECIYVKFGDTDKILGWVESAKKAAVNCEGRRVILCGFDCEWCPPWWREGNETDARAIDAVDVIQLYAPASGCIVISTEGISNLPKVLRDFFEDPCILKCGTGVAGDAHKIARDFGVRVRGVLNMHSKYSLEQSVKLFCPSSLHFWQPTSLRIS